MKAAEAPEVRLENRRAYTKEEVLRLIVAHEIQPFFLRPHLDQGQYWAFLCGFIGDRGGGKSGSCAAITIIDHAISNKNIFSNMPIRCEIRVDDDTAKRYGLNSGGIVVYESQPLDKDALLSLDERYQNSCLLIEEINVQYANVRRPMANTNVDFNIVSQQLRHFGASMIYNVIDEMFIDPQLRSLTDVFVKTYDTAFDIDALANKKPRGLDFRWDTYPMSGYLCGEQGKYKITKKTMPPVYFHFAPWRKTYDDMYNQRQGIYTISTKDKNKKLLSKITTESSPEMTEHFNKWGWLVEMIRDWKSQGINYLKSADIARIIGRPLTREIKNILPIWGVIWDQRVQGYVIEDFELPEPSAHE